MHSYANGSYFVELFADGTKARYSTPEPNAFVPKPEQMDLKITNWCDAGCGWCHEKSTTAGLHADLDKTAALLESLNPGTEIAIGGGDPLSHPDFVPFVRLLRSKGLVPAVTINGRHFARSKDTLLQLVADKDLFGIGLSIYNKLEDWDYPHLIHHAIAGITDPHLLMDSPQPLNVLVLGYKSFGRGAAIMNLQPSFVNNNIAAWYRLLPLLAQKHSLSFDNLAIEQLAPRRLFLNQADYAHRYMGPEGLFSMYVDAVTQTYALCSYDDNKIPWRALSIEEMFQDVRRTAHPHLFAGSEQAPA